MSSLPAPVIDAIVPARDAAATLGQVLASLPARRLRSVRVVDRGSRDATPHLARDHGAVVLREPGGGYGAACQAAIADLAALPRPPDVVLFVPGDAPHDAAGCGAVLDAITDAGAELAITARTRGVAAAERLAIRAIAAVYRHRFAGLGPTRAIRFSALVALGMSDRGDGWDVEMLVRALRLGLAIVELPAAADQRSPLPAGRTLFHILRHATVR
ncbi:MAG: glycosyltransferase [Kofleriaceae bacterium]|jgi:glycosyltransferase involved in cell wall biosynthesis|nr:glycosyltransferase [Kofleriaceae bacterium]MBP6838205.1 glycosyltransferase [Kofleriaceae bacterium]MBP9208132.1 glycosyltransferase [Kofleriaceae bacterium]